MKRRSLIVGSVFGLWTVLGELPLDERRRRWAECQCKCGSIKPLPLDRLFPGRSKSCGCEKAILIGNANRRHGESSGPRRTSEYHIWDGIIQRCENPNHTEFHLYGGRGISICSHWRNSYGNFLQDMRRRPSPNHTVDRTDKNGNYEPGNCTWELQKSQCRNTRFNIWVLYNGERRLFIEVCEELGINYATAWDRLKRRRSNVPLPFTLCTD